MTVHARRFFFLSALAAGVAFWFSRPYWSSDPEAEMARLAVLVSIDPGARVADVGAGKGEMARQAARIVGPSGLVFATEIEPDKREGIAAAFGAAGLDRVRVLAAGETSTNLPDRCCDAIYARRVYHHLTQPEAIAASLFAALEPGGRLAIIDFPERWYLPRAAGAPASRRGHGVSPDLAIAELEHAGFELERRIDDWRAGDYCLIFRKPVEPTTAGVRRSH